MSHERCDFSALEDRCSTMATEWPRNASVIAAVAPAGPPPMTSASWRNMGDVAVLPLHHCG